MSVKVTLYTFAKRENSTEQPTGSGTDFDCVFKGDVSIISPVIVLSASSLIAYNYAYIADFGRYYFIRDTVVNNNNIWTISLECDVLASFKSEIGNASEYVLRAASDSDPDIIDTLYPAKADCSLEVGTSVGVFNPSDITYVIGVLNNETSNKAGAVQYLAMDGTQLADLMQFLLGTDVTVNTESLLTTIESSLSSFQTMIEDGVARSLIKPTDYIVESFAIPYKPATGNAVVVKCGWWETANTADVIQPRTNYIQIKQGTLALPAHPQSATRGHYLSGSPFTRYTLNLGPFGIYPLDATKCINQTSVGYEVYGDNFGNVTCELSLGGVVFDKLTTCVKNPFAIGQVNIDALGAMTTGLSAANNVSSVIKDPSTEGALGAAANLATSVNGLLPQVTRSGSQGNFSGVFPNFESIAEFYIVADEDNTHRGRPLCEVKQISALSGYILVSDPDIAISGTAEENTRIKSYMAGGFYYE